MYYQNGMTFARALFDNVAEMPRELSFKKGDILTVLQQQYEGLSGWWVCSLKNKVGLVPANRLEAMPVLVDNQKPIYANQMSLSLYDELPDRSIDETYTLTYSNLPTDPPQRPQSHCYYNEKEGKVNDDTYSMYQLPAETNLNNTTKDFSNLTFSDYGDCSLNNLDLSTYSNLQTENVPILSTIDNSTSSDYHSNRADYTDTFMLDEIKSSRGSLASDIHTTPNSSSNPQSSASGSSISTTSSDFMMRRWLNSNSNNSRKFVYMTVPEALTRFNELQSSTTGSCKRIIEFVKSKWTSVEMLRMNISAMEPVFRELDTNLVGLLEFINIVMENANRCGDRELSKRILKQRNQIEDTKLTVKECIDQLDNLGWNPEMVARSIKMAPIENRDCLNKVVTAARNLLISIRSFSSNLKGNATILFSDQTQQIAPVTTEEPKTPAAIDSSVYVSLTKSDTLTGGSSSSVGGGGQRHQVPNNKQNSNVNNQVLKLFVQQIYSQSDFTKKTVDEFITVLSNCNIVSGSNSALDSVLTNSKFVVRTGTQLVCIAKNLTDAQLNCVPNDKVEVAGNKLCDSLKQLVVAVKQVVTDNKISSRNDLVDLLNVIKQTIDELEGIFSNSNLL